MRRRHRSSLVRRMQDSWQSVSYRRRRMLFKVLIGLLGSTLSVLAAWMIVVLLS